MGRFGHRLFEGDQDWDIEGDLHGDIQKKLEANGVPIDDGHMRDLFHNMDKPEYRPAPDSITSQELLDHLNSMSEELFNQYRAKPDEFYGEYTTVVLGAVMMKAGVNISEDSRNFLLQAANRTQSHPGYRLPIGDMGFRDPGKMQFIAALSNYENGKPRDFHGPSCFRCGKINTDIAPASLKKCIKCNRSWYCDRDCQKADWKAHKQICGPLRTPPGADYQCLNQ